MTSVLPSPQLVHVCDLAVHLGQISEMGRGKAGRRRIIPIIGGTVTGPLINGTILDVGADWQTVYADGSANLDTRYALETDDCAVIEIINLGLRHGPAEVLERIAAGDSVPHDRYYMRTHARLESGDPRYAWVNNALFVGTGQRLKDQVIISLFKIA